MGKISPKHALNAEELKFCRIYCGFGEMNHGEAYRRAFLRAQKGGTHAEPPTAHMSQEDVDALPPVPTREATRRGARLIEQPYIKAYIAEIGRPAGEIARGVLAEQALLGEGGDAQRAAGKILEQEDKLGFRDAVEQWIEHMCEVGAEIEVPLPDRFQMEFTIKCECGKEHPVVIDEQLVARAPMRDMFPKREG